MKTLTLAKFTGSCKRLILVYSDNTSETKDFETFRECFALLQRMKHDLPEFTIRDIAGDREYSSKK